MSQDWKTRALRLYLWVFGLGNLLVHPVLPWLVPELFFWTPRNLPYEFMIGAIYLAMGFLMIRAAKDPLAHKSFVDFVILANLFHDGVMIAFGVMEQPKHLYGDVLWIGGLALIPLVAYPWGLRHFLREQPGAGMKQ